MNKNYVNKSIIPLTTALIISMVTSGCAKRQNKVIDLINDEDYSEDFISLSAPKNFITDLIDDNTTLSMIDAKKYFEEINTKYIEYIYALDLSSEHNDSNEFTGFSLNGKITPLNYALMYNQLRTEEDNMSSLKLRQAYKNLFE